jgi:hypothetical protein
LNLCLSRITNIVAIKIIIIIIVVT